MAEMLVPGTPGQKKKWTALVLCNDCGAVLRLERGDLSKVMSDRCDCSYSVGFDCPCCHERQTLLKRNTFERKEYDDLPKYLKPRPT